MFRKIRHAFLVAALLCVAIVPVAQASPAQYVDELGQDIARIFDFFDDLLSSVWSNAEGEGEDPKGDEPPPPSSANSGGGDGQGGGDDGTPEHSPDLDPIG